MLGRNERKYFWESDDPFNNYTKQNPPPFPARNSDFTHERTLVHTRVNPDPNSVKWIASDVPRGQERDVAVVIGEPGGFFELDRATGLLLDHAGIDVSDATRGQVTHLPTVPYVAPRQEALPTPPAGQM